MNRKRGELNCSVLMTLYDGDKAQYFIDAISSMLNQTVTPDEIVLTVDGPIKSSLKKTIDAYAKKYKIIKVIMLPKNLGAGTASNEGLRQCRNELVAKMDADDVSAPNRLELQLTEFNKNPQLALLGGQLEEFEGNINNIVAKREVPLTQNNILKFAKKRSPFNHVTTMYKKTAVLKVGGYPSINRSEDYLLFAKILASDYRVKNLPQTLVYSRLTEDAIKRRKTWRHTREMISVRNKIRKMGLSNLSVFLVTALAQILIFITPACVTNFIYKTWLRK